MSDNFKVSVIVSVYNEEDVLDKFWDTLKKTLIADKLFDLSEIIFVNDGSLDRSEEIILDIIKSEKNIRLVNFNRNFGHEAAMIAGIDHAQGDYAICLDADLQHPPALISEMIQKAQNGCNIVLMKRLVRKDGGFLKNVMSKVFYAMMNRISPLKLEENASDFFLVDKKVIKILKTNFRERIRFLRGYIQLLGLSREVINYTAPSRIAGKSKYRFNQLISLSTETIVSFSKLPLKLGLGLGLFFGFLSFVILVYSIYMFIFDNPPSGYTTLITTMSFFFSIQFFLFGIIGTYIGFLFDEIKNRPIYLVRDVIDGN